MSHIVSIATEVRDPVAIQAACGRLQLAEPVYGPTRLFRGEVTGWAVKLPDWHYPLVCDVAKRTLHYDNYGGRWGAPAELNRFMQAYSIEKTKLEARRQGHHCSEQPLSDGSIKLTLQVGGTA